MTLYNPQPVVTLAGVNWASDTVNSITITGGRSSVDDQPRASYCKISLVNYADRTPSLQLNDRVEVTVLDSSGNDPVLFDGYVTDIERSVLHWGPQGETIAVDITCVGPLARLARLATDATYPKQYDGERIGAILNDVLALEWDELDPALIWDDIPSLLNWITIDPGYVGTIASPGDFEISMYDQGIAASDSLCDAVARSSLGVLYETPDGLINYDTASTRKNRAASSGFLELDAGYLRPQGLNTASRISELINDLSIVYKNGAAVSGTVPPSILQYGNFSASISTMLEQVDQAQAQLDLYLETRSIARSTVGGITVPLHNPDLPDATRDALLGAYCGMPIQIPNLPHQITALTFRGFAEGYVWNITNKTADLSMIVSDYALSAIQEAWRQVDTSEAWNNINTSLSWAEATEVA